MSTEPEKKEEIRLTEYLNYQLSIEQILRQWKYEKYLKSAYKV